MDTPTGTHDTGPGTQQAGERHEDGRSADNLNSHQELDDTEGADAFETAESARTARRTSPSARQDESLISLDPPD